MKFENIDWSQWSAPQDATLLFVFRRGAILLIDKKRGLGAGKINGPGGRLEAGETAVQGAIRELEEELLVTPEAVEKAGEVLFQVVDGTALHIHVFRADGCIGEPRETSEAVPRWHRLDDIPYERMWESDKYWYPLMLAGTGFEARTLYDGDVLLGHEVIQFSGEDGR